LLKFILNVLFNEIQWMDSKVVSDRKIWQIKHPNTDSILSKLYLGPQPG
jgi:hypothetical protein